jgi:hypothetical protein
MAPVKHEGEGKGVIKAPPEQPPIITPAPAVSAELAITDIHQGDHFKPISTGVAVLTVLFLLMLAAAPESEFGAVLFFLDILLLPFFLPRAWQHLKWQHVRLPPEGYYTFAKGKYRSGHTELIEPEEAVLGLTPERLYLSTISGKLESLHWLQASKVGRGQEQEEDKLLTFVLGTVLLFGSFGFFLIWLIRGWKVMREWHMVLVSYEHSTGMGGELRFVLRKRQDADRLVSNIDKAIQDFHMRMAKGVQPRTEG